MTRFFRPLHAFLALVRAVRWPPPDEAPDDGREATDDAPRCLLFDDDYLAVKMIRLILEADGWQVAAVQNETDLQSAIQDWRPDVVLLDVMISDRVHLAGLTVAHRLHQRHPDLPVVLSSSLVLAEDVVRNTGAVGMLPKPIDTSTFSASLRIFLPSRRSPPTTGDRR